MIGEADNAAFGLALGRRRRRRTGRVRRGCARLRRTERARGVTGPMEDRALRARRCRRAVRVVTRAPPRTTGPAGRDLPPARATYVDALGSTLERTGEPTRALAPLGDCGTQIESERARVSRPTQIAEALTVAGAAARIHRRRDRDAVGARRWMTNACSHSDESQPSCHAKASVRGRRVNELRDRIVARGPQGRGRPGPRRRHHARGHERRRSPAARRRSGRREDVARERVRARGRRRVPARAVHARHAAVRSHRHDDAARRRSRVPARPGVHQPAARRRDQPHSAQDAGRAARVDAGDTR